MKNILIVGSGYAGSIVARELAEKNYRCTVIEKRNHIGGNTYDYENEHGIRIHKYGPHYFHTNNEEVFNWLSKFTKWVKFEFRGKAMLEDGRLVTLPVNKETKEIVGEENVLDIFFIPYTRKMWGLDINEIDRSVINRIPTRDDLNDKYFPNDKIQFMPSEGYTKMFENILDHKNIKVMLNTSFDKKMESEYDYIFNSMAIDEYYDYMFGDLPYRSLKFYNVNLPLPRLFPVSTVYFTHNGPYTRISEWKNIPNHCMKGNNQMTSLTYEEPCDYKDNNMERYYPIKDANNENEEKYNKYVDYHNKNNNKTTFIGRCGTYKYLDMHLVVSNTLLVVKQFLNNNYTQD